MNLWIIGDSTAAHKEENKRPEAGWGEKIGTFLKPGITVKNFAQNGRSTKSFIDEGYFAQVAEGMKKGDYLFIQFGHNDQKIEDPARYTEPFLTYQDNLAFFVQTAKEKGVTPVIFSSVPRRKFLSTHRMHRFAVGKYPYAAHMFAKRNKLEFIDAYQAIKTFYEYMGYEDSKKLFLQLKAGEHPNYPDGKIDNTHANETGAFVVASIIAGKIAKNKSLLRTIIDSNQLIDRKQARDYVYGNQK